MKPWYVLNSTPPAVAPRTDTGGGEVKHTVIVKLTFFYFTGVKAHTHVSSKKKTCKIKEEVDGFKICTH
jgi:hypothetical protein